MSMPESNVVVVTGGAGFIGSHVVHALRKKGIPVRVFDSLLTGKAENLPDDVELVIGDIRDQDALEGALAGAKNIVHLAALVSVPESVKNPDATHEVNVVGMRNMLSAAERAHVERVVYASSAAIYGNDPELPKQEGMTPHPASPYALSKVENEKDARSFTERTGIPTMGLRFFNIFGSGQSGDHAYASVIPRWIEALNKGEKLHVYGTGEQTRDFIDVRDIAEAVSAAIATDLDGARIYNVASGAQVSLRDLRDLISDIKGEPVVWVEHPVREGDIQHSVADVSAIKADLGYFPQKSLKDGLKELLS